MKIRTLLAVAWLILTLVLPINSVFAFNPSHLEKFLKTGQCPRCDLSNAVIENKEINNADLRGADLSNITFTNVKMYRANLKNANLQFARISDSEFKRTLFEEATLKNAVINKTDFSWSDFTRANLDSITLRKSTLNEVVLNMATLRSAKFVGVIANKIKGDYLDLSGAKLLAVDMFDGSFTNSIWNNVKIIGGALPHTDFSYSEMKNVYFNGVSFKWSIFTRANLQKATLFNSNYDSADFRFANLTDAEIGAVNFKNVNLLKAEIKGISLVSVHYDNTTWIDGSIMSAIKWERHQHQSKQLKHWVRKSIEGNSDDIVEALTALFRKQDY